jgi:precorrin-6x reductase
MVGGLRRDRIRSQRERQGLEKRAMKVSQWREAARSATGSNDRIPIQFGMNTIENFTL